MTSEIIASEDAAAREAREATALRKQSIADAVTHQTDTFYCEVCDKRYTKVTEFENHLSSYDHHHKKRFREMQQDQRARAKLLGSAIKKREKKDPALVAAEAAAKAAASTMGVTAAGSTTNGTSQAAAPPLQASEQAGLLHPLAQPATADLPSISSAAPCDAVHASEGAFSIAGQGGGVGASAANIAAPKIAFGGGMRLGAPGRGIGRGRGSAGRGKLALGKSSFTVDDDD